MSVKLSPKNASNIKVESLASGNIRVNGREFRVKLISGNKESRSRSHDSANRVKLFLESLPPKYLSQVTKATTFTRRSVDSSVYMGSTKVGEDDEQCEKISCCFSSVITAAFSSSSLSEIAASKDDKEVGEDVAAKPDIREPVQQLQPAELQRLKDELAAMRERDPKGLRKQMSRFLYQSQCLSPELADLRDECTLGDLLDEPWNRELKEALIDTLKACYGNRQKKVKKGEKVSKSEVKRLMLRYLIRPPTLLKKPDDDGTYSTMLQSFRTTTVEWGEVIDGADGYPSELDLSRGGGMVTGRAHASKQRDAPHEVEGFEDHNTNLGDVLYHKGDVARVVAFRSGRTNNASRLLELVATNAQRALEVEGIEGPLLRRRESGFEEGIDVYEFKQAITSYQDLLRFGFMGEAKEVKKLFAALSEWPKEGVRMTVKHPVTGEFVTIILKKPIVCQQSFNRQAFRSWLRQNDEIARLNSDFMETLLEEISSGDGFPEGTSQSDKDLAREAWEALDRGKYPGSEEKLHPADAEIYRITLLKILGYAVALQCKSGTDRTGIGVALATAIEEYHRKYGEYFVPCDMTSWKERLQEEGTRDKVTYFCEVFTDAMDAFALSLTTYTKGEWGLMYTTTKGGGLFANKVPYKYLLLTELDKAGQAVRSEDGRTINKKLHLDAAERIGRPIPKDVSRLQEGSAGSPWEHKALPPRKARKTQRAHYWDEWSKHIRQAAPQGVEEWVRVAEEGLSSLRNSLWNNFTHNDPSSSDVVEKIKRGAAGDPNVLDQGYKSPSHPDWELERRQYFQAGCLELERYKAVIERVRRKQEAFEYYQTLHATHEAASSETDLRES